MFDRILADVRTNFQSMLRLFFVGIAMGTADVIPGVSGGTMAFIFGIYDELLQSVKLATGQVPRLVMQGRLKDAIAVVPWRFLVPLFIGIGTAVVTLAQIIEFLLEEYPMYLAAFFFGLVLVSILFCAKRVGRWSLVNVAAVPTLAVIAFFLVGLRPAHVEATYPIVFFAGSIAICAMILPGISGSFLLLIFGLYESIIGAIKDFDMVIIAIFGTGAVLGLGIFSRFLTWLMRKNHDLMVASLIGLMFGSLRVIWPWQKIEVVEVIGDKELVSRDLMLPNDYGTPFLIKMGLIVGAIVIMILLESLNATQEHHDDIEGMEGVGS